MPIQALIQKVARFASRRRRVPEMAPSVLVDGVRFPYGPFRFRFDTVKQTPYTILASTDLVNWSPIDIKQAGHETEEYVDSDAHKCSHRFYRVETQGVASSNVIGYVSVPLPPGFCLLTNPFGGRKTVGDSFQSWPDGTTLSKYDSRLTRLGTNTVVRGKWTHPAQQLLPGEGAIFFNPTGDYKTHNFVGEVAQGTLTIPIPSGFSLCGSLVPKPGNLSEDLHFPIADGDVIHVFDRDRQKYVLHPFTRGKWQAEAPVLSLGEGFWVAKAEPGNWTTNLTIGEFRPAVSPT